MTIQDRRTLGFAAKSADPRYWWFSSSSYDPPIFNFLSSSEWEVMKSWFDETDAKFPGNAGECNVPAISLLMGIVMGNNVSRIAQLGHYHGYSTLLLGFMLRRMNKKNALFSIDISAEVTAFTQSWLDKASLNEQVKLSCNNSADPGGPERCLNFLGGQPQVIFLDSSHQYAHTLDELDLWYGHLAPGGFIFLHDASTLATQFDIARLGGVKRAIEEWRAKTGASYLGINEFCAPDRGGGIVYQDACGMGIIQKPN